jgi:hypothetical protein
MFTTKRLTASTTVTLVNPWSGAESQMTWGEIQEWARAHVHGSTLPDWLAAARRAARANDGATLGRMIIGS